VRVAVTGSSGWVGSHVSKELLDHGHEVIGIDLRPTESGVTEYRHADLLDIASLEVALQGCDAVVHLAAVPDPGIVSPEELFKVNVLGSMHVLEAATRAGVKKFVGASSDDAIGFSFRVTRIMPEYFPIDEQLRAEPQEEYGLGKILLEEMCRSYTSRGALNTIMLRTCYVWDAKLGNTERLSKPEAAESMLWLYVHVLDAARAYRLAVENTTVRNATLWIAAKDAFSAVPTKDRLELFYPDVPVRRELGEYGSLVNGDLAKELIGFEPEHSWHDFV
jgi:nucleoside-diphosphate-sugar epimerase